MIISNRPLQKYGPSDHRETARLSLARLRIGEGYHWAECPNAQSASKAGLMVSRWGLSRKFTWEAHDDIDGYWIVRTA